MNVNLLYLLSWGSYKAFRDIEAASWGRRGWAFALPAVAGTDWANRCATETARHLGGLKY